MLGKAINKLFVYTGDFFLCLLIAPVGVLKIAHRQMKRKKELIRGGEKLLILGVFFLVVFFILLTDSSMLTNPFFYMYAGASILSIVLGGRLLFQGLRFKKYLAAVENHDLYTARDIAALLKLPESTVAKDLMQMVGDGFFPNYKFDSKTKRLQLNDSAIAKRQSKAVECSSCGASVTVFEGEQNRCEYCNEALNY